MRRAGLVFYAIWITLLFFACSNRVSIGGLVSDIKSDFIKRGVFFREEFSNFSKVKKFININKLDALATAEFVERGKVIVKECAFHILEAEWFSINKAESKEGLLGVARFLFEVKASFHGIGGTTYKYEKYAVLRANEKSWAFIPIHSYGGMRSLFSAVKQSAKEQKRKHQTIQD